MTKKSELASALNAILKEGTTVAWNKLGKDDLQVLADLFSDPVAVCQGLFRMMSDEQKAEVRKSFAAPSQAHQGFGPGGRRLIPTLGEVAERRPLIRAGLEMLGVATHGDDEQ